MATFSAPENKVQHYREIVLAWTMQQMADFAKNKEIALSAKTISRVESGRGTFARVTFSRILQAINAALRSKGLPPITEPDLFPTFRPGKTKLKLQP